MLSLALLLTAGCRHEPELQSLTVTEPNEVDLVGVYEIEKLQLPAELANLKLDTQLELKADGTFSARNIPPSQSGESMPTANFPHTLVSCTGVWSKRKSDPVDPGQSSTWGIYLVDKPYTIANVNGPRREWLSVQCTGQAPPYGILFPLGDPAHGYAIHLKYTNPKANPATEPRPGKTPPLPNFSEPSSRSRQEIK